MKQSNKLVAAVIFIGLSLFGVNSAEAYNSQFASSAEITINVNGISNNTNPGSVIPTDLMIFGGVYPQPDTSFYSFEQDGSVLPTISGDAILNNSNPTIAVQPKSLFLGDIFSHTFSINGYANDGAIDSYNLGLYGVGIHNISATDIYQVDFDFSYALSAHAGGQSADTEVSIDYFSDEDANFVGYDRAYSSAVPGAYNPLAENIGHFSITIGPDQTVYYLADVAITGNLTAAPVPVPSAAWLFVSGVLGIFGLKKRRVFAA